MRKVLAKLQVPEDRVGLALIAWRAGIIIAAAVTCIFSYLAAMAAGSAKCNGMHWVAGHSIEPFDLWAWPFISVLIVTLFSSRTRKAIILEQVKRHEEPVFRFAGMRIGFAEMALYPTLVAFLVILGGLAAIAVFRYGAIVRYCAS